MIERSKLITRAEGGDANAQFALANTYWPEGGGNEVIQGDMREAIKWLRKAAEQSHVQAQLRLAVLVGEDDIEETLKWLRAAAEQGNPEAAMERCYYLMEFLGNEVEAIKWYKLARVAGHPHRGDALGIEAPVYRDLIWGKTRILPKEKIPRERRLAKAGDPKAQYRLGTLFANGGGVLGPLAGWAVLIMDLKLFTSILRAIAKQAYPATTLACLSGKRSRKY